MKYSCVLLILALLYGCSTGPQTTLKTGLEGKEMPSFNLLLMDSIHHLNTNEIPKGKPVVFLLISPFCPYCRAMTQDIASNTQLLKDVQFYVISPFPFDQIKHYYGEFQLDKYPNITVGQDYTTYFQNYFKATGVPYMAIYDRSRKLKQVLIGKTDVDVIKSIAYK